MNYKPYVPGVPVGTIKTVTSVAGSRRPGRHGHALRGRLDPRPARASSSQPPPRDPRDAVLGALSPSSSPSSARARRPVRSSRASSSGPSVFGVRELSACSPARFAIAGAFLVVAVLVQTVILSPMRLPGAVPDVVLVVVIAFGIATGLRVRLRGRLRRVACSSTSCRPSDGTVGRWALVFTVAGWLAGKYRPDPGARRVLAPPGGGRDRPGRAAGLCRPGAAAGRSAGRPAPRSWPRIPYATLYDVILAAFVVPAVGALVPCAPGEPSDLPPLAGEGTLVAAESLAPPTTVCRQPAHTMGARVP